MISKKTEKVAVNYFQDNFSFTIGDVAFREAMGIAFPSDIATFMANVMLHYHERE